MRQIANITEHEQIKTFSFYLLTEQIKTKSFYLLSWKIFDFPTEQIKKAHECQC